jgi:hypothetical protein
MRRLVLFALLGSACGGGSPTAPSTPTRIIGITGTLAFGTVAVGSSKELTIFINNGGNSALTISGISGPSVYSASWTNGVIPAGGTHASVLRFTPAESRTYNGTVIVSGDQTSGTNTIAISGTGLGPPFSKSGTGNTVFDMPVGEARVRIVGTYGDRCQNFIVHIGGRSVVNEILGTCSVGIGPRYEGLHLVSGGVVEVTNSTGVSWSIQEER